MRNLLDKFSGLVLLIVIGVVGSTPLSAGFGNWTKFTATSSQSDRPITIFKTFAKDEICGYAAPYIGGSLITPWQADEWSRYPASSVCPGGSLKQAWVSFQYSVTATNSYLFEFRNSVNPSSAGDMAATIAASYNQAGILGRSWEATMTLTPYPSGGTPKVVSARDYVTRGKWRYWLRGPVVTEIIVENTDTDRADDFGWRETRAGRLTGDLLNGYTSFKAGIDWSGLATPFYVQINFEIVSVCYATYNSTNGESTLYVGTTTGANSGCQNIAGRGQLGTGAYNHYAQEKREIVILRNSSLYHVSGFNNESTGNTSITVNDASGISSVTYLKANWEIFRVCNKSGNTLTIGTGNWGCSGDSGGRAFWGTRYAGKINDSDSGGNYQINGGLDNWSTLSDVWADANHSRYKSLHPIFVVSLWNNWPAAGIEYMMYNPWFDKMQHQMYTVAFDRSLGATTYTVTGTLQGPMTGWKYPDGPVVGTYTADFGDRKIWDGTPPAAGVFDYNLHYLRYVGAVPFDTSVSVNATGIGNLVGTVNYSHSDGTAYGWLNSDKGAIPQVGLWGNLNHRNNCSACYKGLGAVGGRPDIALAPQWQVAGLFAMGSALTDADKWQEGFFGTASCSGYIPYHIWESDSTKLYCNPTDTPFKSCTGGNLTVPAFRRPVSIDARPGFGMWDDQNSNDAADRILYTGSPAGMNWQIVDGNAHWPLQSFLPWLLTGDYYYKRNLLDETDRTLHFAANNPAQRKGSWGWPTWYNMSRPISWWIRTLSVGTWAQPTGSPEYEHFIDKLKKWVEIQEGRYNITDGMFYRPCSGPGDANSTPWCWGRRTEMRDAPTTEFSVPGFGNVASWGWNDFGNTVNTRVYHVKSYWMDNFGILAAGWAINLGFDFFKPIMNRVYFRDSVDRAINPEYGPYLNGEYRDPFIPCRPEGTTIPGTCNGQTFLNGEQRFYNSYAALKSSWNSVALAKNNFDNDGDKQGGYSTIYSETLQFAEDVFTGPARIRTGRRAMEWVQSGGERYRWQRNQSMLGFLVSPRYQHEVEVRAFPNSSGGLRFIITGPDGGACKYSIYSGQHFANAAGVTTQDDAFTTIPAGAKSRAVVLTGQSAGNKTLLVTCGNARGWVQYSQP